MFAVYGNSLMRKDRRADALRVDRIGRVAFPLGLILALSLAVARSIAASGQ
jgi:hypothetical protein